jgi:hypothetical protein
MSCQNGIVSQHCCLKRLNWTELNWTELNGNDTVLVGEDLQAFLCTQRALERAAKWKEEKLWNKERGWGCCTLIWLWKHGFCFKRLFLSLYFVSNARREEMGRPRESIACRCQATQFLTQNSDIYRSYLIRLTRDHYSFLYFSISTMTTEEISLRNVRSGQPDHNTVS